MLVFTRPNCVGGLYGHTHKKKYIYKYQLFRVKIYFKDTTCRWFIVKQHREYPKYSTNPFASLVSWGSPLPSWRMRALRLAHSEEATSMRPVRDISQHSCTFKHIGNYKRYDRGQQVHYIAMNQHQLYLIKNSL